MRKTIFLIFLIFSALFLAACGSTVSPAGQPTTLPLTPAEETAVENEETANVSNTGREAERDFLCADLCTHGAASIRQTAPRFTRAAADGRIESTRCQLNQVLAGCFQRAAAFLQAI